MAAVGLRNALMMGFLVEEFIEDARTIWWYWHTATKQVSKKDAAGVRFLRSFSYVDIDYDGERWILKFAAQAKGRGDIANEMKGVLGNVYIPFYGYVNVAEAMYKDCRIRILALNVGREVELGSLGPGEARELTLAVDRPYSSIDFKALVSYTVTVPILNVDYTATDEERFSVSIDPGDYEQVRRKWRAEALKGYVERAEAAKKELDRMAQQIDSLLGDWLEDKRPSNEILAELVPLLGAYERAYRDFMEAQEAAVNLARQWNLVHPKVEKLTVYRLAKGAKDLPPRTKLQAKLKEIEADVGNFLEQLRLLTSSLRALLRSMEADLGLLRSKYKSQAAALGAQYAKARTEADRRKAEEQFGSLLSEYINMREKVKAGYEKDKNELLSRISDIKAKIDKKMAQYLYLTGRGPPVQVE